MSRSVVNSDSLKRFSRELKEYDAEIQEIVLSIDQELNSFIWRDPQGAKFHADFSNWKREVENEIHPLLRDSYKHLDNLVMAIDDYNE